MLDQLDRETMRIRRYGPFPTRDEADQMLGGVAPAAGSSIARKKESKTVYKVATLCEAFSAFERNSNGNGRNHENETDYLPQRIPRTHY